MDCSGCNSNVCGPDGDQNVGQMVQYVTTLLDTSDEQGELVALVPVEPEDEFGLETSMIVGEKRFKGHVVYMASHWDLVSTAVDNDCIYWSWRRVLVVQNEE